MSRKYHLTLLFSFQLSTPWSKILMSPCVWALFIANITTDWGLYTFLTNIPTFLHEVLMFDIKQVYSKLLQEIVMHRLRIINVKLGT